MIRKCSNPECKPLKMMDGDKAFIKCNTCKKRSILIRIDDFIDKENQINCFDAEAFAKEKAREEWNKGSYD